MPVTDFSVTNFMATVKSFARPNQFMVNLAFPNALRGSIPNAGLAEQKMKFYCSATNTPQSNIGITAVPFRGRVFKLVGDRTFEEWTVNIYNDVDWLIRDAFETWADMADGVVNHDQFGDDQDPLTYMSSGDVFQLSKNGEVMKDYKIIGIWPVNVGPIQLDWSANDQIEVFQTTFATQWFETNVTRNNTSGERFARTGGGEILI